MSQSKDQRETVILVHGFLRTGLSLLPTAKKLERAGFHTQLPTYWTLDSSLEQLATRLHGQLEKLRVSGQLTSRLHFLTHSLGGLVVRRLLQDHHVPEPGKVVMLCPPNQGAERARQFQRRLRLPWGRFDPLAKFEANGSALRELAPEVPRETGIIAGGRGRSRGWSGSLRGDNDGTVRLQEMLLEGVPTLQIPAHHSLVMYHPSVLRQAVHFFQRGSFNPEDVGTIVQPGEIQTTA